jgi:uncharacterized membrane protein
MNKYNAKKVEIDGIVFASRAEGRYYEHLLDLMHDGVVESFEMQKPYTLLDKFPHPKTGKTIRAIKYVPDFEVIYTDGRVEVVDVKGMQTDVFRMKCKLFMFRYQIPLVLVKYNRTTKKFIEVL